MKTAPLKPKTEGRCLPVSAASSFDPLSANGEVADFEITMCSTSCARCTKNRTSQQLERLATAAELTDVFPNRYGWFFLSRKKDLEMVLIRTELRSVVQKRLNRCTPSRLES